MTPFSFWEGDFGDSKARRVSLEASQFVMAQEVQARIICDCHVFFLSWDETAFGSQMSDNGCFVHPFGSEKGRHLDSVQNGFNTVTGFAAPPLMSKDFPIQILWEDEDVPVHQRRSRQHRHVFPNPCRSLFPELRK